MLFMFSLVQSMLKWENVASEVQQSSDITYRIYDYERLDPKTGEKRN